MRICVTADLHGYLPVLPDCDLVIVAGDVCPVLDHAVPRQRAWLLGEFSEWLRAAPAHVIGIAGNHDFALKDDVFARGLDWEYLYNEQAKFDALTIWGTPYAGDFSFGWAFMGIESVLAQIYGEIPEDADIVISHGPPYGALDFSKIGNESTGSRSLREQTIRIRPQMVACGHIHEAYGVDRIGQTLVVNASHVNLDYKPVNDPIVVEIEDKSASVV